MNFDRVTVNNRGDAYIVGTEGFVAVKIACLTAMMTTLRIKGSGVGHGLGADHYNERYG